MNIFESGQRKDMSWSRWNVCRQIPKTLFFFFLFVHLNIRLSKYMYVCLQMQFFLCLSYIHSYFIIYNITSLHTCPYISFLIVIENVGFKNL